MSRESKEKKKRRSVEDGKKNWKELVERMRKKENEEMILEREKRKKKLIKTKKIKSNLTTPKNKLIAFGTLFNNKYTIDTKIGPKKNLKIGTTTEKKEGPQKIQKRKLGNTDRISEDDIPKQQRTFVDSGTLGEKKKDPKKSKLTRKIVEMAKKPKKPETPKNEKALKRTLKEDRAPLLKNAAPKPKVRPPKPRKIEVKRADPMHFGMRKTQGSENALVLGPRKRDQKTRPQKWTFEIPSKPSKVAFPPKPGTAHVLESHDQDWLSPDKKAGSHDQKMAVVQATSTRPQIPTMIGQQQPEVVKISQKRKMEEDCGRERGKRGGKEPLLKRSF